MTKPTGSASSTSTTEPTLRSRISSAISRTVRSGAAVTTDSVMTSRISTRASLQSRAVAHRTAGQLAPAAPDRGADPASPRPSSTSSCSRASRSRAWPAATRSIPSRRAGSATATCARSLARPARRRRLGSSPPWPPSPTLESSSSPGRRASARAPARPRSWPAVLTLAGFLWSVTALRDVAARPASWTSLGRRSTPARSASSRACASRRSSTTIDQRVRASSARRCCAALALLALAYAVTFLAVATRARRPELPRVVGLHDARRRRADSPWRAVLAGSGGRSRSTASSTAADGRRRRATSARAAADHARLIALARRRSRSPPACCWSRSTRCASAC